MAPNDQTTSLSTPITSSPTSKSFVSAHTTAITESSKLEPARTYTSTSTSTHATWSTVEHNILENNEYTRVSGAVIAIASVQPFSGKSHLSTGICFLDHMIDQFTSHGQIGITLRVSIAPRTHSSGCTVDGNDPDRVLVAHKAHVDYAKGSLVERPHDDDIFVACGAALGCALRGLVLQSARNGANTGSQTNGHNGLVSGTQNSSSVFCCPLDEAYAEADLRLSVGTPTSTSTQPSPKSSTATSTVNLAPYGTMPKCGRRWIGCYRCNLTPRFFDALMTHLQDGDHLLENRNYGGISSASLQLTKMRGHNAHHIVESSFKAFARVFRSCLDQFQSGGQRQHGCVMAEESRLSRVPVVEVTKPRTASRNRSTKETTIEIHVNLDEKPTTPINSGVELMNVIMTELRSHAGINFTIDCLGDTYIDDHHTVEDVAIALGQCLNASLGDKAGLARMGCAEAVAGGAKVRCVVDLSNRPYFEWDLELDEEYVGGDEEGFAAMRRGGSEGSSLCGNALTCEMLQHVFESLTIETRATVHIQVIHDSNADVVGHTRDLALASARAYGKALAECVRVDPRRAGKVASSKGTLSV
mmetsp:Transcript_60661/g.70966  ORF Transcript_60661/g.70966 Transcript_60661/m.70966 type:complete len:586 (+) Transcript_60661:69-1826(+)